MGQRRLDRARDRARLLFGYSLTSLPPVRAQLPLKAIVPIALAADTVSVSIAIMELIDGKGQNLATIS